MALNHAQAFICNGDIISQLPKSPFYARNVAEQKLTVKEPSPILSYT